MTALVFAAPYVPPPPPAKLFQGYTMLWTGRDGSEWNLADRSGGVAMLADGVVGLHFPAYDHYSSASPATDGSRWRGFRAGDRNVEWPLLVWSDYSSAEWYARDTAFWASVAAGETGTWTVIGPTGTTKHLDCRLVSGGDHAYEQDPMAAGWGLYQMQLIANQPYWRGEPITTSWQSAEQVEFFDPDGSPGFHISPGASLSTATINNPGDVATHAVWTIEGPFDDIAISVDGGEIAYGSVADGQTVTIDTAAGTAFRGATDVSGLVNPWDPRPIPPGRSVPVTITSTGFGRVSATITPLHRRGV